MDAVMQQTAGKRLMPFDRDVLRKAFEARKKGAKPLRLGGGSVLGSSVKTGILGN